MPEQFEAELAANGTVPLTVTDEETGGEQASSEAIADLEVRMDMMGIEPGDIDTLHLHVMTEKW